MIPRPIFLRRRWDPVRCAISAAGLVFTLACFAFIGYLLGVGF